MTRRPFLLGTVAKVALKQFLVDLLSSSENGTVGRRIGRTLRSQMFASARFEIFGTEFSMYFIYALG
jgi:hypothetical protein